jgi:hypothetical protein
MTQYKGFELFEDIEDMGLRARNRAVVLTNLAVDHTHKITKKISLHGAAIMMGYFNAIPPEERASVMELFEQNMKREGYAPA